MNVTTSGRPGCGGCRIGWLGHPDRPIPCPVCRPHIYEMWERTAREARQTRESAIAEGARIDVEGFA